MYVHRCVYIYTHKNMKAYIYIIYTYMYSIHACACVDVVTSHLKGRAPRPAPGGQPPRRRRRPRRGHLGPGSMRTSTLKEAYLHIQGWITVFVFVCTDVCMNTYIDVCTYVFVCPRYANKQIQCTIFLVNEQINKCIYKYILLLLLFVLLFLHARIHTNTLSLP